MLPRLDRVTHIGAPPFRPHALEVPLFRPRSALLAVCLLGLSVTPASVFAAAEVHRLNIALSATPTSVDATDLNDFIDFYNRATAPAGLEPLSKINFSWLFTGEVRYFVTRNLSMNAGVGQLRSKSAKEYLPALTVSINVRAELISVPVHVGAAYYLQAYNQGDFAARMFFGGGLVSYTHSRTSFEQRLAGTPNDALGTFKFTNSQDGPGYYGEFGVHMFFASRYSVLLSALYRSGHLDRLVDERTGNVVFDPETGQPASIDVSGIGLRMAAVIGL